MPNEKITKNINELRFVQAGPSRQSKRPLLALPKNAFRHLPNSQFEGAKPDVHTRRLEFPKAGLCGLLRERPLLTQKAFAHTARKFGGAADYPKTGRCPC